MDVFFNSAGYLARQKIFLLWKLWEKTWPVDHFGQLPFNAAISACASSSQSKSFTKALMAISCFMILFQRPSLCWTQQGYRWYCSSLHSDSPLVRPHQPENMGDHDHDNMGCLKSVISVQWLVDRTHSYGMPSPGQRGHIQPLTYWVAHFSWYKRIKNQNRFRTFLLLWFFF